MKKLIAILFLASYTTAFCEVHELFKIPFLIEHFSEHKSKNTEMSFGDFLVTHYINQLTITDDFQDDQQLPFRHGEHSGLVTVTADNPIHYTIEAPTSLYQIYPIYHEQYLLSDIKFKIFQPPKFCS